MTLSILNKAATFTLAVAAFNAVLNDGEGGKFLAALVVWVIVATARAEGKP